MEKKILIIYCHPSNDSFTKALCDAFISGLKDARHQYTLLDLYAINFQETLSEGEYLKEVNHNQTNYVLEDILKQQQLINKNNILIFIYPVFWGEAPSKLVGWFQRVWTYGFAYGNNRQMKQMDKALFLVCMGGSLKDTVRQREVEAMKTVMLENRIGNLAKEKEMIIFDRMSRDYKERKLNFERYLKYAYKLAYEL